MKKNRAVLGTIELKVQSNLEESATPSLRLECRNTPTAISKVEGDDVNSTESSDEESCDIKLSGGDGSAGGSPLKEFPKSSLKLQVKSPARALAVLLTVDEVYTTDDSSHDICLTVQPISNRNKNRLRLNRLLPGSFKLNVDEVFSSDDDEIDMPLPRRKAFKKLKVDEVYTPDQSNDGINSNNSMDC